MLDNIKQAHRRKSLCRNLNVFQGGPHYLTYATLQGVSNPGKSRFHQDHFVPGLLNRLCYIAISTANVENRSGWWKKLKHFENTAIPVPKPKRRVFDREA